MIRNETGETLLRKSHSLDHGIWTPDDNPPALETQVLDWESESNGFMTGTEGRAFYQGPSGTLDLYWDNPFIGSNEYAANVGGSYILKALEGPSTGSNVTVFYSVTMPPKPAPPAAPPPAEEPPAAAPPPEEKEEDKGPEDHSGESHVPKVGGSLTVISPKAWLIDLAWQVVNNMEWNPTILEMTENRHGSQSGAPCPVNLPQFDGVARSGTCKQDHDKAATKRSEREAAFTAEVTKLKGEGTAEAAAKLEARKKFPSITNDFHSWCGDFVTWLFWKAWMVKGAANTRVTKEELGKFLNREALNGSWAPGENLSMVEAYARGVSSAQLQKGVTKGTPSGLLVFHEPSDDYFAQPGDIFMANRASGGHISIVASCEATPSFEDSDKDQKKPFRRFVTLDGKSFDMKDEYDEGWLIEAQKNNVTLPSGSPQGIAQTHRRTDTKKDPLRGFIDASKLREALGYR